MKYLLTIILIFVTIVATGCSAKDTDLSVQTRSNPIDQFSSDVPN